MTTYTWNPPGPPDFADWNTPADWQPTSVPDGATADVVIPEITASGSPYAFFITIDAAANYVVNSLTVVQNYLILDGTLAIAAGLTLGAGSEIDIAGSLSVGSLSTLGAIDIQGSGEIGSANTIDNSGEIIGSGLTLNVAGLRNDGTLSASGSLEVDVGTFANLASGTLAGGTYEALDGGVLTLNVGADIVTDAATIIFGSGMIATNANGDANPDLLTGTLQTIAPVGVLSVQGLFAGTVPLLDAGTIQLAGGTLSGPGLTVQAGGTLTGSGLLSGPLTNDGSVTAQSTANNLDLPNSGMLVVEGQVAGTGTMTIAATGTEIGIDSQPSFNTLDVVGAMANAVAFGNWNDVLVLGSPADFTGTITGFTTGSDVVQFEDGETNTIAQSDSIVLAGLSANDIANPGYSGTSAAGTLSFQDAGTSVSLAFVGDYSLGDFVLAAGPQALSSSPPSLLITETLPCFLAGTRLLTERGKVAVEELRVGDPVRTLLGGGTAPVRWIGHRHVDCARHPCPADVSPIRVQKNAFGMGRPHRDLLLSPDHAIYVEGVLIPVRHLLNGTTVRQTGSPTALYFHVELARHNVVLAEGLPCETYLDLGNRAAFANGGGALALHPDFGRRIWQREGCAELILGGPVLERVRAQLRVQAELLGVEVRVEGAALSRFAKANCR